MLMTDKQLVKYGAMNFLANCVIPPFYIEMEKYQCIDLQLSCIIISRSRCGL